MTTTRLAVIGGTGLYAMEGVMIMEEIEIPTPFGLPSDLIMIAKIGGQAVAFLPRHGRGHRYLPSEVPSLANIWALKSLGVEQIVSVSAVGSLVEGFSPGDFVLCDQLIDKTSKRPASYFGAGIAGHVAFAEPFCGGMREAMARVFTRHKHPFHESGTYVCMEGPLFSSRAESELHRSWKAHLIGMTAVPEAKLAREAEICYATIAMVTDYDCWKASEEGVSVNMIMETMRGNTAAVKRMVPDLIGALAGRGDCGCRHSAQNAVMTDPALIPYDIKRKLSIFYGKYWNQIK
jgi:5'-methylthioadenosine phosphorylase